MHINQKKLKQKIIKKGEKIKIMKNQEKIKEILERIRSNKNKGTNELAATEEVATLNATNEATLNVASARGITTTTITADNYLYLE